jgi:hypothetical protein
MQVMHPIVRLNPDRNFLHSTHPIYSNKNRWKIGPDSAFNAPDRADESDSVFLITEASNPLH